MDTHFAGRYLYSRNSTIKNMAATSYPSKLTLEGDVRFYDWKTVDGLDSSTLIELPSASENEQLSALFDISAIIERYHENNLEKNIVLDKDGTYYVHGAVAFFGGGRNLSTVVFDGLNEENKSAFTDLNDPLLIGLDDEAIGSSTNRSILESFARLLSPATILLITGRSIYDPAKVDTRNIETCIYGGGILSWEEN